MKKMLGCLGIGVAALVVAAVVVIMWFVGVRNQIVVRDEAKNQAWAQVENVYQRRLDLIPNLVSTVKGATAYEKGVLEEVTKLRSQVGSMKVSANELSNNPEALKQYLGAQDSLGGALSRLIAVSENYPQLKANENFRDLMAELSGTENRIAVERKRFQESVQAYNTYIRVFPQSWVASMSGFKRIEYFKSAPEAAQPPKVQF